MNNQMSIYHNGEKKACYPLVSVIVPVYNVEDYIENCIRSIVEQSYLNLEIILIDDCGKDESIKKAEFILNTSKRPWVCLSHSENKGLAAARNTGSDYANGEYIYFVDSDDVILPWTIDVLVRAALNYSVDMVFGTHIRSVNANWCDANLVRNDSEVRIYDAFDAYQNRYSSWIACNRLINSKWYRSTGVRFIDGIIHEDMPWSLSLALRANKVAIVDTVTYLYIERKGSIMASKGKGIQSMRGELTWLKVSKKEMVELGSQLPSTYWHYHSWLMGSIIRSLGRMEQFSLSLIDEVIECDGNITLRNSLLLRDKYLKLYHILKRFVGRKSSMFFVVTLFHWRNYQEFRCK